MLACLCLFTYIYSVVIVCKYIGAVCKLLGLHRNVVKVSVLPRCDALSLGVWFTIFQRLIFVVLEICEECRTGLVDDTSVPLFCDLYRIALHHPRLADWPH